MTSTTREARRAAPAGGSAGRSVEPVLDRAVSALAAKRAAEVALLVAATEWAEAHPAGPGGEAAGWGERDLFGEGFLPLAGEGAPVVAEFAPVALGAALGWTTAGAQVLIGDGLEIKHRLPRLWSLVAELRVPVHLAREVAQQTRHLAHEAARDADRLVTADPAHLDSARVEALVRRARLFHEPDLVTGEEEHALAHRRVELHRGSTPATTEVSMILDTPDAEAFDAAVARTADVLKRLGDGDGLDIRRARAVGVLADPQRALDLLTPDPATGTGTGTPAGPLVGPQVRPPVVRSAAVLWLHLDHSALLDLDTFPAPVTLDRLGTVSSDLVRAWLAETTVIVRPVLDLARTDTVDTHDPPAWMADLVRLRDPCCVFPGCRRRSRACDLDHIDPYLPLDRGGPPGQTRPDNLAPLCRRHHRAKTHAGWNYHRRPDGAYHWTSPAGRTYVVLPTRRT